MLVRLCRRENIFNRTLNSLLFLVVPDIAHTPDKVKQTFQPTFKEKSKLVVILVKTTSFMDEMESQFEHFSVQVITNHLPDSSFDSWMENNLVERISEGVFQNSTSIFEL